MVQATPPTSSCSCIPAFLANSCPYQLISGACSPIGTLVQKIVGCVFSIFSAIGDFVKSCLCLTSAIPPSPINSGSVINSATSQRQASPPVSTPLPTDPNLVVASPSTPRSNSPSEAVTASTTTSALADVNSAEDQEPAFRAGFFAGKTDAFKERVELNKDYLAETTAKLNIFTGVPTLSADVNTESAQENRAFLNARLQAFIHDSNPKNLESMMQNEATAHSFLAHLLVRDLVMIPGIQQGLPSMLTQVIGNYVTPLISDINMQREMFRMFNKDVQRAIQNYFVATHLDKVTKQSAGDIIFDTEDEEDNKLAKAAYTQAEELARRLIHKIPAFTACSNTVRAEYLNARQEKLDALRAARTDHSNVKGHT